MHSDSAETKQTSTLYVKELPSYIKQDRVIEIFQEYGSIESCELKSSSIDSRTAIITFSRSDDAMRALSEMNYSKIDDRTLYISKKSSKKPDSEANIVISGLGFDILEHQIHQMLQTFGEVICCRILRNKQGHSKGICYAQFEHVESANKALASLQDATIDGSVIKIEKYISVDKRDDVSQALLPNMVCVEGPNDMISKEALTCAFSSMGTILDIFTFDGFSAVVFEKPTSVLNAVNYSDIQNLVSVKVRVSKDKATKIFEQKDRTTVFINDLQIGNVEEVRDYFSTAGNILNLDIQTKQNGMHVAVCKYDSLEAKNKAIETLDYSFMPGSSIPVRVIPFFNKANEKQVGLLIVQNLQSSTTHNDLRKEFSRFGEVISVAISPSPSWELSGAILFDTFQNAFNAQKDCGRENVFLFPEAKMALVISGFTFSKDVDYNIVVIPNLPSDFSSLNQMSQFSKYGLIYDSHIAFENGRGTLFIRYSDRNSAYQCVSNTKEMNSILLSSNSLQKLTNSLSYLEIGADYYGKLIYATTPGPMTNSKIFQELSQYGVEGVLSYSDYIGWTNLSKCVLLLKETQFGQVTTNTLLNSATGFSFDKFRTKGGQRPHTFMAEVNTRVVVTRNEVPEHMTARQCLFEEIKKHFQGQKVNDLFKKVEQMSLVEQYNLYQNVESLRNWIENEKI